MTKKNQPLVTVIIPTIGRPKYIIDAIKSVLAQSYKNIEILISDNAPSVSTKALLTKEFGQDVDSRINVINRLARVDFSEHMNLCIADAHGHYLMILSDDDLICESYVGDMVSAFILDQELTVCLGVQRVINEHGEGKDVLLIQAQFYDGLAFIKSAFTGQITVGVSTYLSLFAKKEDIVNVGGFKDYPDGSNADNHLFYSLVLKGRVAILPSVMSYRVYANSVGLSTPFEHLLKSCVEYSRDMQSLLNFSRMSPVDARNINYLIKKSSFIMMLYRLKHLYWHRMGIVRWIRSVFFALVFFVRPIKAN